MSRVEMDIRRAAWSKAKGIIKSKVSTGMWNHVAFRRRPFVPMDDRIEQTKDKLKEDLK